MIKLIFQIYILYHNCLNNIFSCPGPREGELLDMRGHDTHQVPHPAVGVLAPGHLRAHLHQAQHPGEPHQERVRPGRLRGGVPQGGAGHCI